MRTSFASIARSTARAALLVSALVCSHLSGAFPVAAQETPAVSPINLVYAATDLNLRKGPGESDAIFTTIPYGAELQRRDGGLVNDYIPVSFEGVEGWVFALGVVSTPKDLPALVGEEVAGDDSLVAFDGLQERVTISPLLLRSAPSPDSETLVGMPEGSVVYLTQEGYENGYITVDYGGLQGWAYADYLADPAA
jgi:uncharacterized protein YraI